MNPFSFTFGHTRASLRLKHPSPRIIPGQYPKTPFARPPQFFGTALAQPRSVSEAMSCEREVAILKRDRYE